MNIQLPIGTEAYLNNEELIFVLISKDGLDDNIYTFQNKNGKKVSYIYNICDDTDYPKTTIKQNPNIKTLNQIKKDYENYKIEAIVCDLIPLSLEEFTEHEKRF